MKFFNEVVSTTEQICIKIALFGYGIAGTIITYYSYTQEINNIIPLVYAVGGITILVITYPLVFGTDRRKMNENNIDKIKAQIASNLVEAHSYTLEEATDSIETYEPEYWTTNDMSAEELANAVAEDDKED